MPKYNFKSGEKEDTLKEHKEYSSLAKKLEKEADKSLTKLYKMAGIEKPKELDDIAIASLTTALKEKYTAKHPYHNPNIYITAQNNAANKALEAKKLAKTLGNEAQEIMAGEELLKANDSLKKATREARGEYLKAFYPVRYKLGQIASSLSPFKRRTSNKTSSIAPRNQKNEISTTGPHK
jgi:hypothetical protein